MINNRLHTPEGVKDYLPCECRFKTEVEKNIENVFTKYGYNHIASPTFEYMEVFNCAGSIDERRMYKFIDRDGSILALRSDMTPAIARIAATVYNQAEIPLRFYYIENAFRYNENYQGKLREFTQAGVELIGVNSFDADAEVIAVAINSLLATGLKDFRIDIGHVEFFDGVLDEAGFNDEECKQIEEYIIEKEYTAVEEIVRKSKVDGKLKEFLSMLPAYIGGYEMLEKVKGFIKNKKALNAIYELEAIYEILKGYKLEKYVRFDFSIVGQLEYYTGIIFRGYTKGTGFSIIDGGRYDKLIEKFGQSFPAVGCGVKINDLVAALESKNIKFKQEKADTLLVYTKDGRNTALEVADELRSTGLNIENSLFGDDLEKNKAYAISKGMGGILFFVDDKKVRIFNLKDNSENEMDISQLLGREE